jgi:MFS superfamily sulfate permease-like transporter
MLVVLAPGWKTELDRGPGWLFVKLYGPDGDEADAKGLAESLCSMLRQELKGRLLLELEHVQGMPLDLVDELHLLRDELERQGAILRLCGLAAEHESRLCESDFSQRFTHYRDREEAIAGFYRPGKPR